MLRTAGIFQFAVLSVLPAQLGQLKDSSELQGGNRTLGCCNEDRASENGATGLLTELRERY